MPSIDLKTALLFNRLKQLRPQHKVVTLVRSLPRRNIFTAMPVRELCFISLVQSCTVSVLFGTLSAQKKTKAAEISAAFVLARRLARQTEPKPYQPSLFFLAA